MALVNIRQRLAQFPGLAGQVGKGLGKLLAGGVGAGGIALGHGGDGLLRVLQIGGEFLQGIGSLGGLAQGFLRGLHIPLRAGGGRAAAGVARGFFEIIQGGGLLAQLFLPRPDLSR